MPYFLGFLCRKDAPCHCTSPTNTLAHLLGDYEGRHAAGLWIASTRVEKWNDTSVSERCKGRGMSWKETGVLAMALHAAWAKRNAAKKTKTETEKHTSL